MPESSNRPVYQVDAYCEPVVVRVEGRACFANSAALQDFFAQMIGQGKLRFVMDFAGCTSMDSTFLGVLAGDGAGIAAAESARQPRALPRGPPQPGVAAQPRAAPAAHGRCGRLSRWNSAGRHADGRRARAGDMERARLVLEAHENLVAADPANRGKFQDVLAFLRNRVEQG